MFDTRFQGRRAVLTAFVLGVVVATAATAGAASLITGRQIKDGTIAAKDLSRAVRAQLAWAGVRGPAGPAGPAGVKGDAGSAGPAGATGATGLSGYQLLEATHLVQPTDTGTHTFQDSCPAGTVILGGGVSTFNSNIKIKSATPLSQGPGDQEFLVAVEPASGATFGGSAGGSSVISRFTCAVVAP